MVKIYQQKAWCEMYPSFCSTLRHACPDAINLRIFLSLRIFSTPMDTLKCSNIIGWKQKFWEVDSCLSLGLIWMRFGTSDHIFNIQDVQLIIIFIHWRKFRWRTMFSVFLRVNVYLATSLRTYVLTIPFNMFYYIALKYGNF
jgi:hypothetical protein